MKKIFLFYLTFSFLCAGCVLKSLHDPENEPLPPTPPEPVPEIKEATIAVTINWDDIEGTIADSVEIRIDDETRRVSSGEQPDAFTVTPGTYEVLAYSALPNVNVIDGIAVIENDGYIGSIRDFFSAIDTVDAVEDQTADVNMTLLKNTRQLTVWVDSLYVFESYSGTLTNVAGAFNIRKQQEEEASTISFTSVFDSVAVNLFGIVGSPQMLKIDVKYSDYNFKAFERNVTDKLSDFNNDKISPKEITVSSMNP